MADSITRRSFFGAALAAFLRQRKPVPVQRKPVPVPIANYVRILRDAYAHFTSGDRAFEDFAEAFARAFDAGVWYERVDRAGEEARRGRG